MIYDIILNTIVPFIGIVIIFGPPVAAWVWSFQRWPYDFTKPMITATTLTVLWGCFIIAFMKYVS